MKVKIGEVIELDRDIELKTALTDTAITAREGDRCIVTADGWLRFLNGEARGKMIGAGEGFEIDGYDHENIAKMIVTRLNGYIGLDNILEDYDIEQSSVIEEIESVLDDIL